MTNLETKRFLGTEDVADVLDCTQRQVLYLIDSGQLKAERINRRPWVILREDVEEYQRNKKPRSRTQEQQADEPLDEAA
jgi:excisionase family DNA binding protein